MRRFTALGRSAIGRKPGLPGVFFWAGRPRHRGAQVIPPCAKEFPMKRIVLSLVLLIAMALPAFATEYWSGYDSSGRKVEVIVRYGDNLKDGADVFVRDSGSSTQVEGTVTSVNWEGARRATVDIRTSGGTITCEISR